MAPRCSCRSGCSPCSLRRNDDTAKFSHVNYSGTIVDRVERALYHTWDALIDAVAEETLIAGGGHHGYRRCFAVRGSTTCTRARRFHICFSQGLPKWARDPRCPCCCSRSLGSRIRIGRSDPANQRRPFGWEGRAPILQSGTQPWASRQRSRQKMSSFTMGECPVDNRPREPFRISSILASVVSCNGDANKTNISRPIRERPNHRAETDLRPAPSRI